MKKTKVWLRGNKELDGGNGEREEEKGDLMRERSWKEGQEDKEEKEEEEELNMRK